MAGGPWGQRCGSGVLPSCSTMACISLLSRASPARVAKWQTMATATTRGGELSLSPCRTGHSASERIFSYRIVAQPERLSPASLSQASPPPTVSSYLRQCVSARIVDAGQPRLIHYSTPQESPKCSTTYLCRSSRTWSASQWYTARNRCTSSGVASPAYSAHCHPFLRSTDPSNPCRYARTR